ncbi:N-acetylmuramidase domain-containing protein [Erythrobacter litoralis]|uniref:Putative bacteriophage-acquired protein n=1 Tax=Erythrobacter litoralis (strain HTCC2594) TaxID=314225 RepID=Q2N9G1_ERYLH|nr:N-acetylmuramidase domain-containing protein [Erythrobacter litoralis]ABC63680.1 putative bacteriophage-acquired protein [Erythrobacter litoralis HTCC2594]
MPSEFKGDPSPLTDADFERAAKELRCSVPAIRAVAHVESLGGGYWSNGRPKILFERHIFHRKTNGRFTATHSHISWPKWGGHGKSSIQYDKLEEAMALDRPAALQSASWGAFQIMGFNHKMVGFDDVEDFVKAMVASSSNQLDAFVAFIKASRLDDELRRHDWKAFARGYNGPEYWKNKYDTKMARAFATFSEGGARTDNPQRVIRMGDKGQSVMHLQELLGLTKDGDFGPGTKSAVIKFQKKAKLHPDGIVGGQTWAALLADTAAKPTTKRGKQDLAQRSRAPLRLHDKGDDVKFLQKLLGLIEDGDFGPATLARVKKFQQENGLVDDGIVGRNTWARLLGE